MRIKYSYEAWPVMAETLYKDVIEITFPVAINISVQIISILALIRHAHLSSNA